MSALVIASVLVVIIGLVVFLEYVLIGWWRAQHDRSPSDGVAGISRMGTMFWEGWRITDLVNSVADVDSR